MDFLWILSLAAVSVGLKNFEQGMSIDGPLYAAIARQIARTGEYFRMDGLVPDFIPFAEHPHLGFWIQSIFFKFLPDADWSARISGHLFYVAFLFLLYRALVRWSDKGTAVLTVFLLWIWPIFSNFFSTFYLDPGALYFGAAFLYALARALESVRASRSLAWAALSGLCLGACAMTKGLTVLGFGPTAACLVFFFGSLSIPKRASTAIVSVASAALVLALYVWGIHHSSVPNFLEIYWGRQMTGRFSNVWSLQNMIHSSFWGDLRRDTHKMLYLLPIALLFFVKRPKKILVPLTLFGTFVFMYAPNLRTGAQYWLMVMPPLAWMLAAGISRALSWVVRNPHWPNRFQVWTRNAALAIVLVVQYLPFSTHYRKPPAETAAIRAYFRAHPPADGARGEILVEAPGDEQDFVLSAPYAWYADVRTGYLNATSMPNARLCVLRSTETSRERLFTEKGYRLIEKFLHSSLWEIPPTL